jgi:hypothetical protein
VRMSELGQKRQCATGLTSSGPPFIADCGLADDRIFERDAFRVMLGEPTFSRIVAPALQNQSDCRTRVAQPITTGCDMGVPKRHNWFKP